MNTTYTTAIKPFAWELEIEGVIQGEFRTWGRAERGMRVATAVHGAAARLLPVWTYSGDEAASHYWNRAPWSEGDLFRLELDGETFASRRDVDEYHWAKAEIDAENGWLRAAETNDRYAYEDQQDRDRAAYGL